MSRIKVCFIILFLAKSAYAQNLVKNGGFEQFLRCPNELGEFNPLNWYSIASNSTPDLYSYCARKNGSANPNWYYSKVKPFRDSSYIGIVVGDKKSNYREYLGTRLASKLMEDRTYVVEISLAVPYMSRYTIESLEIVFSKSSILGYDGHTILQKVPSLIINLDSIRTDGNWTNFNFEYTATGNEAHLSIGNFKSRKGTKLSKIKDRNDTYHGTVYNSAYLCIDEVNLRLLNDDGEVNETVEKANFQHSRSPIIVNGIKFRSGSALIENDNISELEEISRIMLDNSELTIEITGHTDNSGNEDENKHLSYQRALNVKSYLVSRGVSNSRIKTKGKGSQNPIGDNNTEDGKLQNRRIEVIFQ